MAPRCGGVLLLLQLQLGMAMVNHSGLGPIAALASVVKTTSHRKAWCTMVVLFAVAGLEKKGFETNLHQATVAGTTTPPPDEPRYQHPIQPQQFETPSLVAATMVAPMVFGGICSNLDLELQALRLLTSLALSEVSGETGTAGTAFALVPRPRPAPSLPPSSRARALAPTLAITLVPHSRRLS